MKYHADGRYITAEDLKWRDPFGVLPPTEQEIKQERIAYVVAMLKGAKP